ncbi:MAG: hypothetical protein EPO24_16720, partial [Bacteroidetes bacterium]
MITGSLTFRWITSALLTGAMLLMCPFTSFAQDILEMFFSGKQSYRMMGENPFEHSSEEVSIIQQAATTPRVGFNYKFNNVYREQRSDGTETLIENYSRSVNVLLPLSRSAFHPTLDVSITSSRFSAIVNQSLEDGGAYRGEDTRFALSYSMRLSNALQFGAMVGQSYINPHVISDYESRISVQISPRIAATLNAGRVSSSQLLRLNITNIRGVMPLDCQLQKTEASLKVQYPAVTLFIRGRRANILSTPEISREYETQFAPQGEVVSYSTQAILPLSEHWLGLLSFEGEEIEGRGKFLSYQRQYGTFSNFGYTSKSFLIGARYSFSERGTLVTSLQHRTITGALTGNVDSWPFVNVFDMPFGLRENYNATGGISFWKAHVGGIIPLAEFIDVGVGISGLRMYPELQVQSWESKFLTYGIKAFQERELAVDVLDAGILSTGLRMNFEKFDLTYSFNQLVPLRIVRKEEYVGDEIGSVSSTDGFTTSVQSSGGQFHQFA